MKLLIIGILITRAKLLMIDKSEHAKFFYATKHCPPGQICSKSNG